MSGTSSVKGRVLDLSSDPWVKAFLYNFKVDRYELSPEHKQWLEDRICKRAARDSSNPSLAFSGKDYWAIWLCGTASRTGEFKHNWTLSRNRAMAVAGFLEQKLRGLRFRVFDHWSGEALSALKGHPDEVEDPLERAVIVAARLVKGGEKAEQPPPVEKPKQKRQGVIIPCCYAYQLVALGGAAQESWVGELGGVASSGSPRLRLGSTIAQPDKPLTFANLRAWGFSNDRAWELYDTHPLFKCRVDQVDNHYHNRVFPTFLDGVRYAGKCLELPDHDLCEGSTIHFGQPLGSVARSKIKAAIRYYGNKANRGNPPGRTTEPSKRHH